MKEYFIPIKIVELEERNYHILVESEFPDNSTGWWVVDTGASKSVFDNSLTGLFMEINSESEGELFSAGISSPSFEIKTGEVFKVTFGDFHIQKLRVALFDLHHINKLYSRFSSEKICGLLGGDFLVKYEAVINYQKKILRVLR